MSIRNKTSVSFTDDEQAIADHMAKLHGLTRTMFFRLIIIHNAITNPAMNLARRIHGMGWRDRERITAEILEKVKATTALEAPTGRPFLELPLGTRFTLKPDDETVWVVLERHDLGTLAKWEGNDGPLAGQAICSAAETREELKALIVYPIP